MNNDIHAKRAEYISRTVELRELFKFASPVEILAAVDIYYCDYYGSLAGWDLGSDAAAKFFNAWGVNVKLTWEVPRYTRTYLLQRVLAPGFTSSRTEVLARFVTFRSLKICSKP